MADEQGIFGLGIVGAGMAAKPHAQALNALKDHIAVRGVWRRNRAELEAFCVDYGFPAAPSYESLLANPAIDAILVLTPPNAREEIVAAAARAGKHVLMEKPVERSTVAAERIVASCEAAGVTLGIIFQHRFRAAAMALAGSRRPPLIEPESLDVAGDRVICYPGDPQHSVREAFWTGPTRLTYRNKRFEVEGGLAALTG